MATQSTHLLEGNKGDSSPQGVVYGEKGNRYTDTVLGNVYECLGSNNWRLIEESEVPLILREIDTYANLTQLDDFKLNEQILCQDRNAKYKVINIVQQLDIYLTRLNADYIDLDMGGDILPIDTLVEFTIKIDNENEIDATFNQLYFLETDRTDGTDPRISIRQQTGEVYRFLPLANYTNLEITTENGTIINESNLPYGEYVTIKGKFNTSVTVTHFYFNTHKTGDGWNQNIHIANIKINGEEFKLNEGTGTSLSSDGSNSGTIRESRGTTRALSTNLNLWRDVILTSKDFINIFNATLELNPINGYVTPQMYGAVVNDNMSFTNDASDFIQYCFDSKYPSKLDGGNYYITKELIVSVGKQILMTGERIDVKTYSGVTQSDPIVFYKNNRDTTVIYSDQQINFITVRAIKGRIKNGVLLTSLVPEHNLAGYTIDINFDLWGTYLENITVYGSKVDLSLTIGNGTKAVYINSDNVSPEVGEIGHLTMGTFSGVIYYANQGVSIPPGNEEYHGNGYFVNRNTFDFEMRGCKAFFNISIGVNSTYNGVIQAGRSGLFAPGEDVGYGHYFNANNSNINVDASDANTFPIFLSVGRDCIYGAKILDQYNNGSFKIPLFSTKYFIENPRKFHLSDRDNLHISGLKNQFKYIVDQGAILTTKVYAATNDAWFDANLLPANDVLNTDTLSEDVSGDASVVAQLNGHNYLTRAWEERKSQSSNYILNKKDLGFVEIVITNIPIIAVTTIREMTILLGGEGGVSVNNTGVKSIQYISRAINGFTTSKTIADQNTLLGRNNVFFDFNNEVTESVIIRLIGNADPNFTNKTFIYDIDVKTRYFQNNPVIVISGGQDIYGKLGLKGADGNQHDLEPQSEGAPVSVSDLVTILKASGILY